MGDGGVKMERENPKGIKFIGWFQIFGALAVLLTLNVEQDVAFNVRFAVPFMPEKLVQLVLVVGSIVIAYGYLNKRKWGYWSMLTYSTVFFFISLFQSFNYFSQPFIGNAIYSAFVAVYTLFNSRYFNSLVDLKSNE